MRKKICSIPVQIKTGGMFRAFGRYHGILGEFSETKDDTLRHAFRDDVWHLLYLNKVTEEKKRSTLVNCRMTTVECWPRREDFSLEVKEVLNQQIATNYTRTDLQKYWRGQRRRRTIGQQISRENDQERFTLSIICSLMNFHLAVKIRTTWSFNCQTREPYRSMVHDNNSFIHIIVFVLVRTLWLPWMKSPPDPCLWLF